MDIEKDCKCNVYSSCKIDKCICECLSYCKKYKPIYDKILLGFYVYYTINPPMKEHETDEFKLNYWLDNFTELLLCSDDLIIVVEYSPKMQLHFHMMIRVKDRIKFEKGLVQKWFYRGNNDVRRLAQPVMGMHYLFKQCDITEKLLGRSPIFTVIDLIKHKHEMKSARLQFKKSLVEDENYD